MTRRPSTRRHDGRDEHGRDEQGIAMITALLIMMITTVIVTSSLALAVHSNGQSADQRNVTAALHAADYGLHEQLASLAGQSTTTGPNCTTIASGILPNTSLPTQWFSVSMPGCSASNPHTIIATGYALGDGSSPSATPPSNAVSRTVVAHVTLQPDGALSNGGYGFPDALLALKGAGTNQTGAISATGLSVTGGPITIRADGPVNLTSGSLNLSSGQTTSSLSSWDNINLTTNPVTGNVASAKTVSLNSSNVSGYVDATTVTLSGTPVSTVGSSRSGTVQLPTQPPVPTFNYSLSDWLSLTGAASPTTACPSAGGTLTGLYVLSSTTTCVLAPTALSGAVAVVVNAAADLTVNLPSFLGSGSQLYLIVTNGNLTISDVGATTPVFGYASGTVTMAGSTIVGQLVGGNITATVATNLIAQSVSTTVSGTVTFPPDFSFPNVASGPAPTGFVPQMIDEYLCAPGVTTAC